MTEHFESDAAFLDAVYEAKQAAYEGEEIDVEYTVDDLEGYDGTYDVRYRLFYLGTKDGWLTDDPYYYEGVWVNGSLEVGETLTIPPDHPPQPSETGMIFSEATAAYDGKLWASWIPQRKPEDAEVPRGLLEGLSD